MKNKNWESQGYEESQINWLEGMLLRAEEDKKSITYLKDMVKIYKDQIENLEKELKTNTNFVYNHIQHLKESGFKVDKKYINYFKPKSDKDIK